MQQSRLFVECNTYIFCLYISACTWTVCTIQRAKHPNIHGVDPVYY